MKSLKVMVCLVGAVLFAAAGPGYGITQYKDGATHNVVTTVSDDVLVDVSSPGVQTTVNVANGGTIGTIQSPHQLTGYSDSRLNVASGGAVYTLAAHDRTHATVSGGFVFDTYAYDNSQVNVSGGTLSGDLNARGTSHVTVSGGSMKNVAARENSQMAITHGSVAFNLSTYDSSKITMSGGTIGGTIALSGQSTLTLDGFGFAINGAAVNPGEIKSILGGSYSGEPFRILTGTLASGDTFSNQFQIGDNASLVLIPEPASLLLIGLGGLVLRRKH